MLLLGLIGVAILFVVKDKLNAARPELVLHQVKYDKLTLTVVERGALESSSNKDIYCTVKAGNKGSTVASQIKYVIDDGSQVTGPHDGQPGRLIVELDSSGLEEQLKDRAITLETAKSAKIQAEQQLISDMIKNVTDLKTAESNVLSAANDLSRYTGIEVAELLKPSMRIPFAMVGCSATMAFVPPVKIDKLNDELKASTRNSTRLAMQLANEDIKEYKTGEYLQELKDDLGLIETAQSDVTQQEDREAWAFRMAKKGYQTPSQAQSEKSRTASYTLALNKVTLQLDVLVKYKKIQMLSQYVTALEVKQMTLDQVQKQAEALRIKDESDVSTKTKIFEQESRRYGEIQVEITKCKIYAPHDGMVVYFVPEQARGGGGTQQSIVAQGEPVREGQKLMQIPDLRHMVVVTKVHEALISQVHKGQKATIRVYSFGGKILHGEVESVANQAAQTDWMSSDVKVYNTRVKIYSKDIEGIDLKPGMSAEVTIDVETALDHVLTVPVQAVFGGSEMGRERKVIVQTPEGPKERTIEIGLSNDRMVEVTKGLEEGDEVVENPKAVVGDKIKTRDSAPANNGSKGPGERGGERKGKGGGSFKGKSKSE